MPYQLVINDKNSVPIAFINTRDDDDDDRDFLGYIEVDELPKPKKKKYSYHFVSESESESDDEYETDFYIENNKHGIRINDKFSIFPSIKSQCINIAAPRESGKSTLARQYANDYLKLFPNNNVIVISCVDSDKAYKGRKGFYRIPLDDDFMDFDVDGLQKSLVIFDDIESGKEPQILKHAADMKDNLLMNGRHIGEGKSKNKIYNENAPSVLVLCHQLMSWKATRINLSECDCIVIFPGSGSSYHMTRLMKVYCGFDNKLIKKILKLNTRWCMIHKVSPQYILSEHDCFFV